MKTLIKPTLKQLALAALLPLSIISSSVLANTATLDQVVAIVDDDVVLTSELTERTQKVIKNFKTSGKQIPPLPEVQQEILEQLILESIQLQLAYRAGVRISDAELNSSLQRIAQQNRMSLPQFRAALEQDGLSYNETREQVRREMSLQQVQQGSVNRRVQITNQEIVNFLASEDGQTLTSPEFRVLHTLIPVNNEAEDSKAKAFAQELLQQIQSGTEYSQVMNNNNGKAFKLSGGDLGWRKAQDLPSILAAPAQQLNKGETGAPIKSPSGYHLIKLVDSRGIGEVVPQTKARHILLKPSAIRNDDATKKELNELRQRALDGEDFSELAREFSEDIGSAVEGGDLGWTNPGQLVGAFQDAMDNTLRNNISPAFRSQYGWHILQVIERREKDVTDDLRKNMARNFLHQRKFDDELETWLQKIRDEAYVDIK